MEEKQYIRFVEKNENEGQTWVTFLEYKSANHDNSASIHLFEKLLKYGNLSNYTLYLTPKIPEHIVKFANKY